MPKPHCTCKASESCAACNHQWFDPPASAVSPREEPKMEPYEEHWRAVTAGPANGHSNVMDGTPFGYGGCPHPKCVEARGGLSNIEPASVPLSPEKEK